MKIVAKEKTSLLELLALMSPDSSKTTLRSWLAQGRVIVEGDVEKKGSLLVEQGKEVEVVKTPRFVKEGVKILFEDAHLVVIDKPAGLLSVATDYDSEQNLHTLLKRRIHPRRVYPVHRLDRETSGVILFAYSEQAREGLKELFFHHAIEREYEGLVEGRLEPETGSWTSMLQEEEDYRVVSHPNKGKWAKTHYRVLKYREHLTRVRFILETGRKNQIRVHCQEAKHPIFGDLKYGSTLEGAPRLCLHATSLAFVHPITRAQLSFISKSPF